MLRDEASRKESQMEKSWAIRSWERVNGMGQVVKVTLEGFIPDDDPRNNGFSSYTGKPYGKAERDCYACSCTLTGAGFACTQHGIRLSEKVVFP